MIGIICFGKRKGVRNDFLGLRDKKAFLKLIKQFSEAIGLKG